VVYQGQGGESLASSDEHLSLSVDGDLIWLKGKSGNGVFNTAPGTNSVTGNANGGTAWITSGTVVAPSELPYPAVSTPAPTYAINFHKSGSTITYDVLEDGAAIASGLDYKSGTQIAIPGKGMAVSIAGAPQDGDTFNLTESRNNLNIFTALDSIITAMETPNQNGGAIQQAVNTGLTQLDASLGSIQAGAAAVGEQLNRMDGVEARIADLKLAAQTEQSNAVDLDMVEAISNFQGQEAGYKAALQSYASIQRLSLFQYINS
jgi:flagellar hook-associated protein 3 FlgL